MQGLKGTSTNIRASATVNLNNLRRSVAWTESAATHRRVEVLSERLESVLVMELHKDGNKKYMTLSVRGLYRYVLACITSTSRKTDDDDNKSKKNVSASPSSRRPTLGLPLAEGIMMPPLQLPNVNEDNPASSADEMNEPSPLDVPPLKRSLLQHRRMRSASVGVVPDGKDDGDDEGGEVTYRERLGGYLHPRDMRRLVTPFSATNEPELIVRRHVMLLNFDPLRTIILREALLVIVPDGADSVLAHLETRVRGSYEDVEASIFGARSERPTSATISTSTHGESSHGNFISRLFRKNTTSLSRHGSEYPSGGDLASLGKRSVASDTEENVSIHSDDDMKNEWDEINRNEWVNLPFELQCADAVLHVVSSLLQDDTYELQEASLNYIQRLLLDHGGMSDDPLTIIRAVKDALREMTSRVKGFVKSLTRTLDEDEDMALMNLSRLLTCPERFIHPVSQEVLEEESDEPELILEAHLQTALTLLNALDLMQGQIDTTAELVDQKQDAVRNRLLYANMVISIFSLCVATASLVGSIFGMNLKNDLEDDNNAFRQVTSATVAGTLIMGVAILGFLTWSGTIPRIRSSSAPASL